MGPAGCTRRFVDRLGQSKRFLFVISADAVRT
jgi:hypothetical protein